MIELLSGAVGQILVAIFAAVLAVFGGMAYGRKKKAEGAKAERRRAEEARADAKVHAEVVREQAAKKPVEQQRKEVSKWEK